MPDSARTRLGAIVIVTLCGAAAAMHIGKASAVLPLLRAEFGTTVSWLALYISLVSLVAALVGLGFGLVTQAIGTRRSALAGLGLLALSSLIGMMAGGPAMLLAARAGEAAGFVACTAALPSLVRAQAALRDQSLAMGIWACWLPTGVAAVLAVSIVGLDTLGWRGLYAVTGAVSVAAVAALWAVVPRPVPGGARLRIRARAILRRDVLLMTAIFVVFAGANMVYLSFLPTALVDSLGFDLRHANMFLMLAMLCLLPTNVLGGRWLDRGARPSVLLVWSFLAMAVLPALILPALILPVGVPDALRYAAILAFGAAAGVPPAVIWASIGSLARGPDEAPVLSGLFYQGAGIGQIAAPVVAGAWFDLSHSWWAAIWTISALCVAGIVLALAFGRDARIRAKTAGA